MKNQFPIIMFGLLGLCACACILLVIVILNTGGRHISLGTIFNRSSQVQAANPAEDRILIPDRFKEPVPRADTTPVAETPAITELPSAPKVQKYFSTFPCSQIISGNDLRLLLADNKLYCKRSQWSAGWANPTGKGLRKRSEGLRFADSVVIDSFTNLMWQRYASKKALPFSKTSLLIEKLNSSRWQGYDNWRLPKIEELMATFTPRKNNAGLHLPSGWNCRAHDLWSCNVATDSLSTRWIWVARTALGRCNVGHPDTARSLLVVRGL